VPISRYYDYTKRSRKIDVERLKSEWVPTLGYTIKNEAAKDIGFYLMDDYNWRRPHQ
jgi:hypothetical protein